MMRVSICALILSLIVKLSENKSLNEDLQIRMDKFTCKIKPMIETWLEDNGISNKDDISVLVRKCGEHPGGTPTSTRGALKKYFIFYIAGGGSGASFVKKKTLSK